MILIEVITNDSIPILETIKLATGLPPLLEQFTIAGFPDGSRNRFKTNDCTLDSVNRDTLFTQISAGLLETNETSANENTINYSGSGIWFEHENSVYLTAIMSEFCIGNPAFESYRIQRLTNSNVTHEFEFYDLSLPKNDIFETKRISQESAKKEEHILSFWQEYSAFIGRTTEISILKDFIDNDEKLLGVTVSGIGGVGKSRLLVEFNNNLNKRDWEVHYIDKALPKTTDKFDKVVNNILVVIDEEKVQPAYIVNLISALYKSSSAYKVRLVFVGRTADIKLKELSKISIEYKNFRDIKLEGLSSADYKNLIKDVISKRNNSIQIEFSEIQNIQNALDQLRRPIFAILIGIAVSDGKNITDWVVEDLLNYYYQIEVNKLRQSFDDEDKLDKHLNLIALLFIIGEPDNDLIKYLLRLKRSWLPILESL